MVFSFMVLVILTTVATGFPDVFLIHSQIQRQAWAQLDQGSRETQALYATWQDEATGPATINSQRPTSTDLLSQRGEEAALTEYLQTLKHDTEQLSFGFPARQSFGAISGSLSFEASNPNSDEDQTAKIEGVFWTVFGAIQRPSGSGSNPAL